MSNIDPKAPAPETVPNLAGKPPIPREEPPPPDPVMAALSKIIGTQEKHGERMDAIVESQVDLATRVSRLEEKAPGSNPPPRTASGFTAAVRHISQTTESEPDKATAAQVAALQSDVAAIKSEMGLQTKMLGQLVDAAGTFIKNPTVRRIAYIAGGLILGWLTHFAHQGITK